ncbi:hypothetical protein ABT186_01810 [Streptomyces sp. NPDC001634]|uniref:hypothetical protein n=1 Tax=Streptomyces sp. NPDC001634 TaxID=3154390 RepID=UPI0033226C60
MTRPVQPRLPVTAWTLAVLRRCYRGEKPEHVLERAARMLATADGHLHPDGRIKTGASGRPAGRPS